MHSTCVLPNLDRNFLDSLKQIDILRTSCGRKCHKSPSYILGHNRHHLFQMLMSFNRNECWFKLHSYMVQIKDMLHSINMCCIQRKKCSSIRKRFPYFLLQFFSLLLNSKIIHRTNPSIYFEEKFPAKLDTSKFWIFISKIL